MSTPGKELTPSEQPTPTIHQIQGGWHAIHYGSWQVSVAPDSLIMLPRHLKPEEAADFCAAVMAAAQVGLRVKGDNEAAGARDDQRRPPRTMVAQGGVPPGASRLPINPRREKDQRKTFTPQGLAKARQVRQTGSQPGGTTRPRVPLPPAPRYPRQLPPATNP